MNKRLAAVEKILNGLKSVDAVVSQHFYIIHFNILCAVDSFNYIPNEIGIVKYSIRNGIEDTYHNFINPGPIPLGYTALCKQISDDTHAIPIFNFELADKNYEGIYSSILKTANPIDGYATFFCSEETLTQNMACLRWLCDQVKHADISCIRLYDVTSLLLELQIFAGRTCSSREVNDFLNTSTYDYIQKTRCDFHENLDSRFCALGCSKRLCFMLSDALCLYYNVQRTKNHLPEVKCEEDNFKVFNDYVCVYRPRPSGGKRSYKPAWKNATTTKVEKELNHPYSCTSAQSKLHVPWMQRFRHANDRFSTTNNLTTHSTGTHTDSHTISMQTEPVKDLRPWSFW